MEKNPKPKNDGNKKVQEVCIDLPGEAVSCWRSSDNIRVILRKQRDVFIEINMQAGGVYAIESEMDFYNPREKKLVRKIEFLDGERLHLWVGREFNGKFILKHNELVLGTYEIKKSDPIKYPADPKVKPEPLMIVIGKSEQREALACTIEDPFGLGPLQNSLKLKFDADLSSLAHHGTKFAYQVPIESPEVREYIAVTEAQIDEVLPHIRKQLDSVGAVVGSPREIFSPPPENSARSSPLYVALATAAAYVARSDFITGNSFKEAAGYLQSNWSALNNSTLRVRIEKKPIGKYRVGLHGRPLSQWVTQAVGVAATSASRPKWFPLGSPSTAFIDGGFGRTGRDGYGGAKRIFLTLSKNFGDGMKIQVVGTVIDIIGDTHTVFIDKNGSKDLTEFLGRVGVSVMKAGATAAIGSIFAAGAVVAATAIATMLGAAAAPVLAVVLAVIAGYIVAATIVDWVDSSLGIKDATARMFK